MDQDSVNTNLNEDDRVVDSSHATGVDSAIDEDVDENEKVEKEKLNQFVQKIERVLARRIWQGKMMMANKILLWMKKMKNKIKKKMFVKKADIILITKGLLLWRKIIDMGPIAVITV
ncbi:hypothetical protein Tco_1549926, partial [Tanacetum coccineum]